MDKLFGKSLSQMLPNCFGKCLAQCCCVGNLIKFIIGQKFNQSQVGTNTWWHDDDNGDSDADANDGDDDGDIDDDDDDR